MNIFEKKRIIYLYIMISFLNHIIQDALTFVKLTIGTGINFAWNLWQAYDIKELYDDISEARIDIVRLKTRCKLSFFINFQIKCHYTTSLLLISNHTVNKISGTELDVRLSAVETLAYTTSVLAAENRKRHTNTDSSLGNLCNLLDRLFATTSPSRQCCYEKHTGTQVGNFMYCLTSTAADRIFAAPSNNGIGICKTGVKACGSLAPES